MKRRPQRVVPAAWISCAIIILVTPPAWSMTGDDTPNPINVLRLARSEDGLTFTPTGDILVQNAQSPDLVLLPNGRLLVLYEQPVETGGNNAKRLMVARSKDAGRSWSRGAAIRFKGISQRELRAQYFDLVVMPDRSLRLFFSTEARLRRGKRNQGQHNKTVIGSAISRDGLRYRLDPRVHIDAGMGTAARPMAFILKRKLHLYVQSVSGDGASVVEVVTQQTTSRDGRRFDKLRPAALPTNLLIGSAVATKDGIRAYVSSDSGIRSFTSTDGEHWNADDGVRLPTGSDAAVVRLRDGTYLMAYAETIEKTSLTSSQLVVVDSTEDVGDLMDVEEESGETAADSVTADATTDEGLAEAEGDLIDADEGDLEVAESWGDPTVDWRDAFDLADRDGFAPAPDFKTRINYLEWYDEFLREHVEDNAYDAYAAFMPDLNDPEKGPAKWPELASIYTDPEFDGPPGPWNPTDHPVWEKSNRAYQDLLQKFRDAALFNNYAPPAKTSGEMMEGVPESAQLLVGIILPQLSHHRKLVLAALADAWRVDEAGEVSPQRMLDAMSTSLRGAAHMDQGSTLIEDLVSIAERARIQETARLALKHHVFNADQMETALDILRELDVDHDDPVLELRGEHGFAMDMTQFLFSPPDANGQPRINVKRALAAMELVDGNDTTTKFSHLTSEDAYESIRAFDDYYHDIGELMRVGYPAVRAVDIDAATDRNLHQNVLTEAFLPHLSRYYQLTVRGKASQRATQLVYATHLYKARNGHWPESLDELPAEHTANARIDPFSGVDFVYRLTEDGPTIYSASENGLDDGGEHHPRWGDKSESDADPDDYVFWPPPPRE